MDLAASVDIGSHSFHLLVVQVENETIRPIDKIRDPVALAAGLDENRFLTPEAITRAINSLNKFGERIKAIPSHRVRAVGTNTLRIAKNSEQFLKLAEAALGHQIEIISGHEEARLIYLGVAHSMEDDGQKRLVVDIGGGSTELILGESFIPQRVESLYIGCVSFSKTFFPDGIVSASRLRNAEISALQELEPIVGSFKKYGWQRVIGSSGTILAIQQGVIAEGWSNSGITASSLKKLRKHLLSIGQIDKLSIKGIDFDRKQVLAGGFAILSAIFESLDIKTMEVSSGALREGVIYDLLGRLCQKDIREKTVRELINRFQIDEAQADRVRALSVFFYEKVKKDWKIEEDFHKRMIVWASLLHEIGLFISYSQYHKHGQYLLNHLDMPGFSLRDQQCLAFLVRSHRRKFPLSELQLLRQEDREAMRKLGVLLRLSVLLNRVRNSQELPEIKITVNANLISLTFPKGWLQNHPLTSADLATESKYLINAGFFLQYS
ncbi:exopolyphosphatase [Candidatus Methylacidiphilum fumarolicum]|uniref:Exopolyphosphatase n=2 Tax=Candidatus Methylacidiphilum fumarolicum TaxID=591154 RepID=I0JVW0_METFB|nr:exopolyphosphatase [Candidatus Methylacidiphilum fumarolicum]MBW6414126.1 exopolyphosphatase [Candidatus Methylacidiphilum fumarolicum]TFE66474.1 exopolyphosphatase [Candidatus Methylacidiphilum fumarolicum]TFE75190.1 exopolyphosphatase [Candidatus Methylacidiphilum fumarolicum]TFE76199.1 exopolyphosphatase [Candidatus Methylacidiphilum fumarolicum]TFE77347.1 exopolyphosphatase [Candidatus Methylacidiphilum fumarolicum]